MATPEDLKRCRERVRRLKTDIAAVQGDPLSSKDRLLLLEARQTLKGLIRHMRQQQGVIRQQKSQATAAKQVAQAYAHAAVAKRNDR